MNVFLWAVTGLALLQLPLLGFALFASRIDALVALQASGGVWTLTLVLLAQGFQRSAYTILGVAAAVLTFAGGMVFARFFERELDP